MEAVQTLHSWDVDRKNFIYLSGKVKKQNSSFINIDIAQTFFAILDKQRIS